MTDLTSATSATGVSKTDPSTNRTSLGGPGTVRPRVAVLFGGRSSEHAVSCASAAAVLRAIDRKAYDVVPIGVARDGRWVLVEDDPERFELTASQVPEVDRAGTGVLVPMTIDDRELRVLPPGEAPRELGDVDVVFPLLHGPWGEDGTLQGMLDLADLRYVGSGVLASAVGMDKHYMKIVFGSHGLPMGDYAVITDRDWRRDPEAVLASLGSLGLPVFVKPARAGSSVGITRVAGAAGLRAAIEAAREHDPKVLVEAAIRGREIECAVLEGRGIDPPRTSEVAEIRVVGGHDFYDFDAKYLSESEVELDCPAKLPDGVADEVRRLASAAFTALGCEGLARVDCFYTDAGEVVINEINTMPGFTPHSMYPRMWAESGLPYQALIDELITLALQRRVGLR